MGRHSTNTSYQHRIRDMGDGCFRLSWTQDRYLEGSRLRHPRVYTRDTDEKGARRFAKKWNLDMPGESAK